MRRHRPFVALLGLLLMLALVTTTQTVVRGQDPVAEALGSLSLEERTVLNTLNERRVEELIVALVPNAILNTIAEAHLNDLLTRAPGSLGDIYLSTEENPAGSGLNIEGMGDFYEYASYTDGYELDFAPIISDLVIPSEVIEYWVITDGRAATPQFNSQQMRRNPGRANPIFLSRFREIGLAYARAEDGRYIYVLVFGSQPNVLPVFVIDPDNAGQIAQEVATREIALAITDERARTTSARPAFSGVEVLRVSELPGELPCPTGEGGDWQPYSPEVPYQLSQRSGLKTVYVQVCDQFGTSLVLSTQVNYQDPNDPSETPSPTVPPIPLEVIGIVNATQTSAAAATLNAPLIPTVEAILTATAQAR